VGHFPQSLEVCRAKEVEKPRGSLCLTRARGNGGDEGGESKGRIENEKGKNGVFATDGVDGLGLGRNDYACCGVLPAPCSDWLRPPSLPTRASYLAACDDAGDRRDLGQRPLNYPLMSLLSTLPGLTQYPPVS
jgi:hypothetical protein